MRRLHLASRAGQFLSRERATVVTKWNYETPEELVAAGYTLSRLSRCSAIHNGGTCNESIEWWRTPEGRFIPLDAETLQPHWSTCVDAELFRRR